MRVRTIYILAALTVLAISPTAAADYTCVDDYPSGCIGVNEDLGDPSGCTEFCVNVLFDPGQPTHTDACVKTAHDTAWTCPVTPYREWVEDILEDQE